MVAKWEESGGMGEKGEVQTASYKVSHRDVKYSLGNIVNNITIIIYGDRWLIGLSR